MFFTQQDYKKIEEYLRQNSRKDTDFDTIPDVKPDDLVAIVQYDSLGNSKNVIIKVEDLTYDFFQELIYGTNERFKDFLDDVPTEGSVKLVRSNGVWHAINDPKVIHEHQLDDNAVSTRTIIDKNVTNPKLDDESVDDRVITERLHKKMEKLTAYLSTEIKEVQEGGSETTISNPVEINGKAHKWNLTGYSNVETYGDEPSDEVNPNDMTVKTLNVIYSSASTTIAGHAEGNKWVGTYNIPNVVGTYTARFDCTYNNVPKYAESTINVNLRKYFGFSDSTPTDVTTLPVSHFSNSVNCTITIPASGIGFKHIYFAVPSGMTITRIVQPDALNAPLAFTQIDTINRVIGGTSYSYKLYQSTDEIDASVNKRLTIS